MNITEGLAAASAKRKQVQEETAKEIKALAAPGFERFMKEHPEIEAIRWTQYTPYFNDGDTCEFGVGELYYKLVGADEESGEEGDGFEYLSTWKKPAEFVNQGWFQDLQKLQDAIQGAAEEMEAAFGDHVRVLVTKDGLDTEHYDHD